jgi:hypothetical protein
VKRKVSHTCRGKRRFRDHAEAVRSLRGIRASRWQGRDGVKPVRCYHCPRCNGWHLTSKAS